MIFQVEMQAFCYGPAYPIRRVTVEMPCTTDPYTWTLVAEDLPLDSLIPTLEKIFYYGQNDFCTEEDRAQRLPSVSAGDVIRIGRRRIRCEFVGWKELPAQVMPTGQASIRWHLPNQVR